MICMSFRSVWLWNPVEIGTGATQKTHREFPIRVASPDDPNTSPGEGAFPKKRQEINRQREGVKNRALVIFMEVGDSPQLHRAKGMRKLSSLTKEVEKN